MVIGNSSQAQNLPIPLDILAGQDLSELEQKALAIRKAEEEKAATERKVAEEKKAGEEGNKTEDSPKESTNKEDMKDGVSPETEKIAKKAPGDKDEGEKNKTGEDPVIEAILTDNDKKDDVDRTDTVSQHSDDSDSDDDKAKIARDIKQTSEDDSIFLGLRVYTSKNAPAEICGQLRHEMELSATLAL